MGFLWTKWFVLEMASFWEATTLPIFLGLLPPAKWPDIITFLDTIFADIGRASMSKPSQLIWWIDDFTKLWWSLSFPSCTQTGTVPTKTQLSNFLGTPGEDYFKGNPKSLNLYFPVIWWGKGNIMESLLTEIDIPSYMGESYAHCDFFPAVWRRCSACG